MTDGFRSRVATDVVAVPQRDPAAFAGIGRGLEALADAGLRATSEAAATQAEVAASQLRIKKIEQDRARSATIADRMGAWPDVQVSIQNKIDDLRNTTGGTAPDYQAKADAIVDTELGAFRDTLGGDPDVLERFAPVVATFAASTRQGERRYAMTQSAKAQGAGIEKYRDAAGLKLFNTPDPNALTATMGDSDRLIDGMDLPPELRATFKDQAKQGYARDFLEGLLSHGDWQGTKGVLASGLLDPYMDADAKQRFLARTENAGQVAAAATAAAAARQLSDARDVAQAVDAKIKAGIVPAPTEFRTARAALVHAGADPAELITFDAQQTKADVNRTYAGQNAATMRKDRDALRAKFVAGRASEAEQVVMGQLDTLVDKADDDQAAGLKELLGQGVPGTVQALGQIAGSPAERRDVAEKLDKGLGFVANLPAGLQAAALRGRETRTARPADFGLKRDVKLQFDKVVGPVAATLGGDYDDALNRAWDIATDATTRAGRSGFDPDVFTSAVRQVTGATMRPGGVAQGGIQPVRGRQVWLPEWMSAPEFDRAISRDDFGGARYAGGGKADKADVLEHYRIAWVGDDAEGGARYGFVDPAGAWLHGVDNRPYVVRLRRK